MPDRFELFFPRNSRVFCNNGKYPFIPPFQGCYCVISLEEKGIRYQERARFWLN